MTARGARGALLCLAVLLAACGGSGSEARPELGEDAAISTRAADSDGTDVPSDEPGLQDGVPRADAAPSTTAQAVSGKATGPSAVADVFVPPAGRYVYDTSGYRETGSGPTRRRSEAPTESLDEVTVTPGGSATEVRTVTSYGSSGQETTVVVRASTARLTRLAYHSTSAGVTTSQSVTPQPAVLVARLPYVVGDRWESAWSDSTLGIQGAGWGEVLRRETVTTGIGTRDAVVLQLHQRLRGSITGELDLTSWIDPATGIVVRQVLVTDLQDATGASHSEITRVLRST